MGSPLMIDTWETHWGPVYLSWSWPEGVWCKWPSLCQLHIRSAALGTDSSKKMGCSAEVPTCLGRCLQAALRMCRWPHHVCVQAPKDPSAVGSGGGTVMVTGRDLWGTHWATRLHMHKVENQVLWAQVSVHHHSGLGQISSHKPGTLFLGILCRTHKPGEKSQTANLP